MPIPPGALRAFLDTDYRVRLRRGGWTVIRIDAPLPSVLHACVKEPGMPWGFITAWNPLAQMTSRASNRPAQRELLSALRQLGAVPCAGVGVGSGGKNDWREPGLFVTGLDFATLDALGRRFRQAAIVRGVGHGPAELRVLA